MPISRHKLDPNVPAVRRVSAVSHQHRPLHHARKLLRLHLLSRLQDRHPFSEAFLQHIQTACMWFTEEPSQFSMGQTAQGLTGSIKEKPLTGLVDCLRVLQACFRKRMSATGSLWRAASPTPDMPVCHSKFTLLCTGWLWWSRTLVGLPIILNVPPPCPVDQPIPPNFHLPKQDQADRGMIKIIVNPTMERVSQSHPVCTVWGATCSEGFWAVLHLPCCPSKQGELCKKHIKTPSEQVAVEQTVLLYSMFQPDLHRRRNYSVWCMRDIFLQTCKNRRRLGCLNSIEKQSIWHLSNSIYITCISGVNPILPPRIMNDCSQVHCGPVLRCQHLRWAAEWSLQTGPFHHPLGKRSGAGLRAHPWGNKVAK